MNFLIKLCTRHQRLGWGIVAVLGLLPTMGYLGVRIARPLPSGWIPAEVIEELQEQQRAFQSNSTLVLVLTCDEFFTPDRISALHQTVAELRDCNGIQSLTWVGDIPEATLLGRQRMLLPEGSELTAETLTKTRNTLSNHPLATENLIAADGRTVLLLMDTTEELNRARTDAGLTAIKAVATRNLEQHQIKVQLTGILALYDVQRRALTEDNRRIIGMAYGIMILLLLVIFRRPVAIILAGSGPVTGVIWTLGWLRLTGQADNELAKIILPVMVMMIGFTDGVHLIMRFQHFRFRGQSVESAIQSSMAQTGPACFLTSLTTAIGFGSLMLSSSDMISGFGLVSAIGVIVTFFAVILVSPLLAASGLGRKMHVSKTEDPITRFIGRFVNVVTFSTRYAKLVSLVSVVCTVAGIAMCARLMPDDRVSDRIPENSEAWRAMRHCDTNVGGIRSVHLMLDWADGTSRDEIWAVIRECESILKREPLLGDPLSIRTALTVIRGKHRPDQSILANQLPREFRERFYRPDDRMASVTARTQDWGFAAFDPMFQRISESLAEVNATHQGFNVRLVSNVILEGRVVSQMIDEMLESLAWAAVIILGVLAISFRSLRLGLIAIVPNILPLVAAGSLKYLIDGSIGIAGTCSLAICLGIAVDDTIHYLIHFRSERRSGAGVSDANRATFVSVGGALMLTTVTMTAGLGTVMTSQLPPQVDFASMALITLLVALPADLICLPALLTLFADRSTDLACGNAQSAVDATPSSNEQRSDILVETAS